MNLFILLMDWDARINILRYHDWLLAPFFLGLLYSIALLLRKRYTKNYPFTRGYFMPALVLRFFGCLCFGLLYQYHYNGGDTWAYHWGAIAICRSLFHDPALFVEIMMSEAGNYSYEAYNFFRETQATWYIAGEETMTVMKIAGFLHLFTFQSYLCSGFILAFLSMIACWKIFEVFVDMYPEMHRYFAYGILFVPSIFFWGAAGLTKDTIVLSGLGFSFWGFYQLFFKRKHRFKSVIYFIGGMFIMFTIKIYVVLAMLPALFIWLMLRTTDKIRSRRMRMVAKPLFFALSIAGAALLFQAIGADSTNYSVEGIVFYASAAQTYLKQTTEKTDGAGYDLGEYERTIGGVIGMIPPSIVVTLFRPYPWEASKPVLLPSAAEGVLTLLATIFVIFRVGFFRTLKIIFKDHNVAFCLIFSLLFAFAVGFTSYNFGSLSRYKIPAMPFYFGALAIIYLDHLKRLAAKRKYQNSLGQPKA